ncbi:hypothetical protein EON63_18145 [archaeon]|nr:MAG: hypothetical protein EON63_18145 [archaeon]
MHHTPCHFCRPIFVPSTSSIGTLILLGISLTLASRYDRKFYPYPYHSLTLTHSQGEHLLRRAGLWDTYGAQGWAVAGLPKREGRHFYLLQDGTVFYNMTAILQDVYGHAHEHSHPYNQTDCMFCKNYAHHKNTHVHTRTHIDEKTYTRIVRSKFYMQDFLQWKLVFTPYPYHTQTQTQASPRTPPSHTHTQTPVGPMNAEDIHRYESYEAYHTHSKRKRGKKGG